MRIWVSLPLTLIRGEDYPWIAVHLSGPHGVLKKAEVAISMDDKGAWRYNVLVERLGFVSG